MSLNRVPFFSDKVAFFCFRRQGLGSNRCVDKGSDGSHENYGSDELPITLIIPMIYHSIVEIKWLRTASSAVNLILT